MKIETKIKKSYNRIDIIINSGNTIIEESLYDNELESLRDDLKQALDDVEYMIINLINKDK
jgi:gamma-glutamyl-gamma-aminobutyrate hydrolase PuuD